MRLTSIDSNITFMISVPSLSSYRQPFDSTQFLISSVYSPCPTQPALVTLCIKYTPYIRYMSWENPPPILRLEILGAYYINALFQLKTPEGYVRENMRALDEAVASISSLPICLGPTVCPSAECQCLFELSRRAGVKLRDAVTCSGM
jgi:hypothetical protein